MTKSPWHNLKLPGAGPNGRSTRATPEQCRAGAVQDSTSAVLAVLRFM